MAIERKYGLDMQLPSGKLPGFYAQIVKGIADHAPLYDRHKELLIFDRPESLPAAEDFLARYKVESERCELLELPPEGTDGSDRFEDFGFTTREGRVFLDLAYAAGFRLTEEKPGAESAPALLQMEEHRIASVREDGLAWFFIERQLAELADKVARAYGCGVRWLEV